MLKFHECKYQLDDHFIIMTKVIPPWTIRAEQITLTVDGVLGIEKGWTWDGPSGPTFDTDDTMVGAVVHDALYRLIACGALSPEYRDDADLELYRQLKAHGMFDYRAWAWYRAVRVFGGKAIESLQPVRIIRCAETY